MNKNLFIKYSAFIFSIFFFSFLEAQNVGIGTTNPSEKLHVVGGIRITNLGGSGNAILITNNNGVLSETPLSGNGTDVLTGAGTFVPITSLDNDWTVSGTNMYTVPTGNIGIGNTSPGERLVVYRDQNISAEIGRVHIGHMGHNDWAGFSHIDANETGNYALLQNSDGRTLLNAASGQEIQFRQNNTDQFKMETDGDLAMLNGNSIKQPNNVRYAKNTNTQSHNNNDNNWTIIGNTTNMNVEPGNIIKLEANMLARMSGGSGNDDFYVKVYSTGTCGAGNHNDFGEYRPDEDGSNHDNFRPLSYLDYYVVPACTGTMSFRLEIRNTGDDSYQVKDAVLFITKY